MGAPGPTDCACIASVFKKSVSSGKHTQADRSFESRNAKHVHMSTTLSRVRRGVGIVSKLINAATRMRSKKCSYAATARKGMYKHQICMRF
eukprot:10094630-Karenia_brevis.AAC.1